MAHEHNDGIMAWLSLQRTLAARLAAAGTKEQHHQRGSLAEGRRRDSLVAVPAKPATFERRQIVGQAHCHILRSHVISLAHPLNLYSPRSPALPPLPRTHPLSLHALALMLSSLQTPTALAPPRSKSLCNPLHPSTERSPHSHWLAPRRFPRE